MKFDKPMLAVLPPMEVGDHIKIGNGIYEFTRVLSANEGRLEFTLTELVK